MPQPNPWSSRWQTRTKNQDRRRPQHQPEVKATPDFISEDDLNSFDGFLRYQAIDPATATSDVLAQFREVFDEAQAIRAATQPIGEIFKPTAGEHRYAVALREGSELWLASVVKRNRSGVFAFWIRPGFLPHASYHTDGTFHFKTDDSKRKPLRPAPKRQRLTQAFKGCEHMGMLAGYGPKDCRSRLQFFLVF